MTVERRRATEAEAKALASSIRLRILRLCLEQALTNKEIADRLGAKPATVLHHVRTLVNTGFLAAQSERTGKRGSREVPYLATRKSWRLSYDPGTGPRPNQAMIDAFLTELDQVTDQSTIVTTRLGLRLDKGELEELQQRFRDLFDEYAQRPMSPDGRAYSLFLAVHPDVGRDTGHAAA